MIKLQSALSKMSVTYYHHSEQHVKTLLHVDLRTPQGVVGRVLTIGKLAIIIKE